MELVATSKRFDLMTARPLPHATVAGVGGLDAVVLIVGGQRDSDLGELASPRSQLRAVVAIGDASEDVIEIFRGDLPVATNSMEDASLAFDYAVRFRADVVLS